LTKKTTSVITLGIFDGVHLGHQKILNTLLLEAEKRNATPVVVTFFPHPTHVLTPNKPLKMINSIEERVELLKNAGVKEIIVQKFTKAFSQKSALDFITSELIEKRNLSCLIVGYDHSFGKDKEGDFESLKKIGKTYNFDVVQVGPYQVEQIISSSTHIRNLLETGNINAANHFLNYPFCLFGKVIKGNQLGRKIGFNTANIELDYPNKIIPKIGVYVVKSTIHNTLYYGMMNIGYRPTVDGKTRTIEVHYFDLDKNLYDEKISVQVLERLRDEVKFETIQILKKQLEIDRIKAKAFINKNRSKWE
jgi:riboflavin kinase/FMN adenylyltransferase